jgi:hypothetical protein
MLGKIMTPHEAFKRWFEEPIPLLESNPDNAFIALMASFALCERYFKSKLHADGKKADTQNMFLEAATTFGVDKKLFADFWEIYRNGIAHFLQPQIIKGGKNGLDLGWEISADAGFSEFPIYHFRVDENDWVVRINPWHWCKKNIDLWMARPDLLNSLSHVPFGAVYET